MPAVAIGAGAVEAVLQAPEAVQGELFVVRLRLTEGGAARLAALSELHLEELAQLAPTMHALWTAREDGHAANTGATPHPAARPVSVTPAADRPPRPPQWPDVC